MQFHEAETLERQVLEITRLVLGDTDRDTIVAMGNVKRSVRGTGWNNNNNSGPRGIRVYRITQRRTANSRSGSAHAACRGRKGKRKDSLSIYPCGRCQLLIHHGQGLDWWGDVSTPPQFSTSFPSLLTSAYPLRHV